MFSHKVNEDIALKLLTQQDADEVFRLTDESREYLREWLPWVDFTKSVSDSRNFLLSVQEQWAANNGFQAGICYRNELAGVIGFHEVNWANKSSSLGYWLAEGFQGKGIMTEACRAMVSIAFEQYGLNRVEIRAAAENHKSRAIPERLGFKEEGRVRQSEWVNNHFVDHVIYGILKEEWAT
ncbi:GNAT family N-acetyltransferase [Alicyclobacillus sp. SO9]|uniref:GNAT family N-acetyltransferase n=1 Tax=Alicyclobacillus sp. SO9 TaxID=2665646 RepID=UPI0018E88687|nr:GNAT family protein [Alicyclobacillus sp. SO9]QQE81429.1 GNAT family N-acetyltransferase [Alicyclobacillus sp. SO9]